VSNYNELKEKILKCSGRNLYLPEDVKISEECKRLLKKLIEPDVKKRIEWKEFFNH